MPSKNPVSEFNELRKIDSQGRIVVGKQPGDSTYSVERQSNGDILLRPVVVMHREEAWLFANPTALAMVKAGLEASAANEVVDLGSFQEQDDCDDEDD